MTVKEEVCSIKCLHKAMLKCKKGVAWKDSVATFTNHGLVRCYKLKHSILDGTYEISKYIEFQIHEPKERNIVSTRFIDRVFQRSLCDNYLTHEIQKVTQPIHFLGFSYQLHENGKVTMRVLPKKISKNRRKLKKMVLVKKLSRKECDETLQAILAHIKKSNNRSQIHKMVTYYKDLWKEREYAKTKNIK